MPGILDDVAPPSYGQRDVPIERGGGLFVPYSEGVGALQIPMTIPDREASPGTIEDRRYMTSPHNPFMGAATRLGPQGYYIPRAPEEEERDRALGHANPLYRSSGEGDAAEQSAPKSSGGAMTELVLDLGPKLKKLEAAGLSEKQIIELGRRGLTLDQIVEKYGKKNDN